MDFFRVLYALYDMMYNTDIIVDTCSHGVVESTLKLVDLFSIFKTPKYFLENIIHNFGYIFDAIRDLGFFFN